jgi:hypothetical protein
VELFKKHWRAVLGGVAILPSFWRGLVWLFDWGARVDLVIAKLREYGGIAAVIEFLINPPPWFIFPAIIIGFLLIWWDTARRQKPIIVGDQANFHSVVEDQPLVGNPTSSLIDSLTIPRTVASRDYRWQFDSQMAVEVAARLRIRPEWQDKIIVDITPEYLWGLFSERTMMQGDKLAKPFLNKWMVICGRFGNVTSSMRVSFSSQDEPERVFMKFNNDWQERLELIMPYQKIAVVGRIEYVTNYYLGLEDCELVR